MATLEAVVFGANKRNTIQSFVWMNKRVENVTDNKRSRRHHYCVMFLRCLINERDVIELKERERKEVQTN